MTTDSDRISKLNDRRRALLTKMLDRKGPGAITRADRSRPLPLSSAQQRLWFLDQLAPGTTSWNATSSIRVRGVLDVDALGAAVSCVVERHEVLRTVFRVSDGEPVQIVLPAAPVAIDVVEAHDEESARAVVGEQAAHAFDLSTGPLLRVLVVRLGAEDHVVALSMHHVVTDAWSQGVLWGDLARAYVALSAGATPQLPALPVQYADFAAWQRAWLDGPVLRKQWEYWQRQLEGFPGVLDLPVDRSRPAVAAHAAGRKQWRIPADVANAARSLAERENATLFMVLLAAYQLVLARYCGVDDVAVGAPVANRPRPELEGLIGFFINNLVLRTDLSGDPTFRELVGRVRETSLGAFAHQDLPFEYLVERLRPDRDLSRHPLVQTLFQIVNTPFERVPWPDAEVELFEGDDFTTRVDLEVHLVEQPGGDLTGLVVYSSALFDDATVERLIGHLTNALHSALAEPDQPISQVRMAGADERERMLTTWNDSAVAVDIEPLPHLIAAQAARTPGLVAVEYEDETITYAELLRRANQLAHRLRSAGAGPDSMVGLCLRRGIDMIVGLVGILQAGAAYVPINAEHPADRIRYVIDNAGMTVVVTEPDARRLFDDTVGTVVLLEVADLSGFPTTMPDSGVTPDNLAYVVYTSGSTGMPKGIAMSGRCVVNMLAWQKVAVPGGPGTRTAQFTELTFDVHVQEVLSALLYGETLVIPSASTRRDAVEFVRWLGHKAINQMFVPNVMIRAVCAAARQTDVDLGALRHISQAGEALSLDDDLRALRERHPQLRIHNHYGSTEVQVVTAYTVPVDLAAWPRTAPVGTATWNHRIYVVDGQFRLTPLGVAGEICVAGPGLARGYVGRAGLTAERFVADPFGVPGSRMYRTGDVGRWRSDGLLEYLGRSDDQVKIRGFRVEPGEVEAVLRRHPGVAQAVVVVRADRPGDRRLVAYVVPAPGGDVGTLRAHVAAAVPEYMVPSAFVPVTEFPLTSTGKIDRRALPAPDARSTVDAGYAAPESPEQEAVCTAFAEIFGAERIGMDDDFFALGGHSLLATQAVVRIEAGTGVRVPLAELFRLRTARALATLVAQTPKAGRSAVVPVGRDRDLPLSFAQEGYFLLERSQPGSPLWNVPFVMRARGPLDLHALSGAVLKLLERHEALRTTITVRSDGAVQRIRPAERMTLAAEQVPGTTPAERESAARDLAAREAARPFELTRGPIFRARVLRLDATDHVIMLTTHHVATDAWSQEVLWSEISTSYAALLAAREPQLPALPVQYADFATWQRNHVDLDGSWAYWSRVLADLPPALELHTDRPRGEVSAPEGDSIAWPLGPELVRAAAELGATQNATLFMTLLAAFQLTLAADVGHGDIVLGSPVAGRTRTEVEGLVGGFANMLILRTDTSGDPTLREVLTRTRETATGAYAHQDMPFHLLAERLGIPDPVRVMFQLVNTPRTTVSLAGTRLESFDYDQVLVRMDLELTLIEDDEGVTAHVLFRRSLFDRSTIERLMQTFTATLTAMVTEPDRRISAVLPVSAAGPR